MKEESQDVLISLDLEKVLKIEISSKNGNGKLNVSFILSLSLLLCILIAVISPFFFSDQVEGREDCAAERT